MARFFSSFGFRAGWLVAALAFVAGCASIPEGRWAVADVSVEGAHQVGEKAILERIATRESPRFLGMFRGVVYDYEVFNRFVLERDLARVERFYRARGFYQARARAGRVLRIDDDHVKVEIVVEEGQPVVLREARLEGIDELEESLQQAMRDIVADTLRAGRPFEEDAFEQAEHALERALTDAGYAYSEVERQATVDIVHGAAWVTFLVAPDRVAEFGTITITGTGELPQDKVRALLGFEAGDRYSTAKLAEAQQALIELGVFATLRLIPELRDPPPVTRVVPVRVEVAPARLRSIRLGGGFELDALKSDVHFIAGWESRNFLGGMRRLSLEAKPGVVLYPLRINNWVAPERPLPSVELRHRLEQPGLFEPRTLGFIEPKLRVYPLLLRTDPRPEDPVIGYVDLRSTVGLRRPFWDWLRLGLLQHVDYALPFAYIGERDQFVQPILLVYPELVAELDFRDSSVEPHVGAYFETSLQSGVLGDSRDVRVRPEARAYIPVGERVTIALRSAVGFLFPFNWRRTIEAQLAQPIGASTPAAARDLQLLLFRGFFAGGPGSNRGYAPRTISPHTVVPFLSPGTVAQAVAAECEIDDPQFDPGRCATPIGGLSLWEASVEFRFPVYEPLRAAVFCDAADVSPERAHLRFLRPHLSCGLGARYATPLGPLRFDLGYRIPGAQVIGTDDDVVQGDPGTIFGAPLNLAVGIGEAF